MTGGGGISSDYEGDLDYWSAPDDYRQESPEEFEIYPENWDTAQLFLRMQTQWRISPTGHRAGLDYTSLRLVAKICAIDISQELFAGMQLMEMTLINESLRHGNG